MPAEKSHRFKGRHDAKKEQYGQIRTMLIPKEGCEFIVADFSAIEARVLAWEAGEQWVLDAF